MAKQTPDASTNALDHESGDPLFNLKHAQAEADLAQKTGGLGPETNDYMSTDEDAELGIFGSLSLERWRGQEPKVPGFMRR